ncbi:hypothetical protein BXY66_2121 [Shimia isoporae]|uniref:Type IV pilus biogenesis protein PilP n=1 Tax=Shimia isoporae TaxID=647720 RepID=A0A4R1NTC0_9RHOB|nr:hypothetical protein [Shimia isoporae]TCL10053.1 hypothetical protein BXY66_2121 [Shimia isoporae]
MSSTLALTLSFEGIGLLTPVDGGWHLLREVGLDSEDLAADLAELRATAEVKGGADFRTLLVLPNDQIKFLNLSPDATPDDVVQVLERETPYTADQLVFDTRRTAGQTQVAAVARDTLAEAEAFASEHAFSPAQFTAMPTPAQFDGAPDFGRAAGADGVEIAFDGQAMVVVGSGPLPEPFPESAEPAPEEETTPTSDAAPAEETAANETSTDQADAPVEDAPAPAAVSFSSRRQPDGGKAPELGGVSRAKSGQNGETSTSPTLDAPLRFDPSRVVAGLTAGDATDETTPAEEEDGGSSFFSRRKTGKKTEAKKEKAAKPKKAKAKRAKPEKVAKVAPVVSAPETEPELPAAEASDTLVAERPDEVVPQRNQLKQEKDQEKERLTVFGSRQNEVRGKPKHLGLILTTILLAFLAAVAVWATYFLDDGVAGLFGGSSETEIVVVEPNASQPLEVAPLADPDETTATVAEPKNPVVVAEPQQPQAPALPDDSAGESVAAVDPSELSAEPLAPTTSDTITDSAEVEALIDGESEGANVLSDAEAEARYAVTGIWQKAPSAPFVAPASAVEDLNLPSIDTLIDPLDAIALQNPNEYLSDAAPDTQINPPPPGATFEFDDRGLVIASAEGTLSPEGIRVFTGRPSVFPANFPKRINVAEALAAEQENRLALARPRLRPDDLIEKSERATLGGLTREELAQKRPKLRPENVKTAAEADTTPTSEAVTASLRPRVRPSNIAQLAQRANPTATEEVAAAVPASATLTPSIPTTASVARQATIQNAINLKKINLIGVYGTSTNRRALVRLSSGRYKMVRVGERIDGGKVAAIGDSELRYVKSGKNITLKMPKG